MTWRVVTMKMTELSLCACLHAVRKIESEKLNHREVGGGQPLIWILRFDLCNNKPAALKSRLKQSKCYVLTKFLICYWGYCTESAVLGCNGIETWPRGMDTHLHTFSVMIAWTPPHLFSPPLETLTALFRSTVTLVNEFTFPIARLSL